MKLELTWERPPHQCDRCGDMFWVCHICNDEDDAKPVKRSRRKNFEKVLN